MIEYRIETEADISKVLDIWRKFLKDDDTWHFTLEGTYIELRVNDFGWEHKKSFVEYLDEKKWKYTKFEYKDNIPITRKYQKQYEKIFHGFSELSMKVHRIRNKEKKMQEISNTIERCVHLVFNIMGKGCAEEADWLVRYAVNRAYTAGKLEYEWQKNHTAKNEKPVKND